MRGGAAATVVKMQVDRFALGGTNYDDVGGKIFQREEKKSALFSRGFMAPHMRNSRNKTEDTVTQTHANTGETHKDFWCGRCKHDE